MANDKEDIADTFTKQVVSSDSWKKMLTFNTNQEMCYFPTLNIKIPTIK